LLLHYVQICENLSVYYIYFCRVLKCCNIEIFWFCIVYSWIRIREFIRVAAVYWNQSIYYIYYCMACEHTELSHWSIFPLKLSYNELIAFVIVHVAGLGSLQYYHNKILSSRITLVQTWFPRQIKWLNCIRIQYFHIKSLWLNSNILIHLCICVSCHILGVNRPKLLSQFCVLASPAITWRSMKLQRGLLTGLTFLQYI
jgi:hypothetical protein